MTRLDIQPHYDSLPLQNSPKAASGLVNNDETDTDRIQVSTQLTVAFFLVGIGVLLPWNALLSVLDYYTFLFPDISFAQYVTNTFLVPMLTVGIITSIFPRLSNEKRLSIHIGFGALALFSFLIPILVNNEQPVPSFSMAIRSRAFCITIVGTAILGAFMSLLQSIFFGMVNLIPGGTCTIAFTSGGGTASVIVAAIRIFARLVWDDPSSEQIIQSLRKGFRFFFAICTVLSLLCNAVFVWLDNFSAEYAHYVKERTANVEHHESRSYGQRFGLVALVLKDVMVPAVSMLLSNMITLLVFPGLFVQLPERFKGELSQTGASWYPLAVVSMFAIGDTIGRSLPSEQFVRRYPGALPRLTGIRLLLIPFYILFWIGSLPLNWLVVVTIITGHGISHGFLVSTAFLTAPKQTLAERAELVGKVMFVVLMIGLSSGGALGWLVEITLRKMNLLS